MNENNQRFNSYLPSCDEYVSTIIDALKDSGIYDKTIIIFFTDIFISIISAILIGMTRPTAVTLFPVLVFFSWRNF